MARRLPPVFSSFTRCEVEHAVRSTRISPAAGSKSPRCNPSNSPGLSPVPAHSRNSGPCSSDSAAASRDANWPASRAVVFGRGLRGTIDCPRNGDAGSGPPGCAAAFSHFRSTFPTRCRSPSDCPPSVFRAAKNRSTTTGVRSRSFTSFSPNSTHLFIRPASVP